jgi:predicted metal-dependent hydrolase
MVALPKSPIRSGGRGRPAPSAKLVVDGLTFDIHRSDRRNTLQVTVDRSGELSVAVPGRAADADIRSFIEEKLLWIHTKIEEKARLQRKAPVKQFVDGEGFLYLGKSYRLRVVDDQFADLMLSAGRFHIRRNKLPKAREVFVQWYSRNALRWFDVRVADYAKRMGVTIKDLKVQDLGYRWASFSPGGRIQFHWKAVLLPPRIAEYVVVHELAHAFYPNHSSAFWMTIEQALPDWELRKLWLAEHGISVEGL